MTPATATSWADTTGPVTDTAPGGRLSDADADADDAGVGVVPSPERHRRPCGPGGIPVRGPCRPGGTPVGRAKE